MSPLSITKSLAMLALTLPAVMAKPLDTTRRSGPPQAINVVWSQSDFSTIAGPNGGNEYGHSSGFALLDEDGKTIWTSDYPDDHSPCYNTDGGRTFTLSADCMGSYQFHCEADFGGDPKHCAVLDTSGREINSADGDTDTNFIGIALSTDSQCGTNFILEPNKHCDPDASGFTVS